jgi:hypothetical protein
MMILMYAAKYHLLPADGNGSLERNKSKKHSYGSIEKKGYLKKGRLRRSTFF